MGATVKPDESTSLASMIDIGLPRVSDKLEEISNSATKEFALQRALTKMKSEWAGVYFECITYRYFISLIY